MSLEFLAVEIEQSRLFQLTQTSFAYPLFSLASCGRRVGNRSAGVNMRVTADDDPVLGEWSLPPCQPGAQSPAALPIRQTPDTGITTKLSLLQVDISRFSDD